MTEAERRQSMFPGKKVEKWEQPLQDYTVQQQVIAFSSPTLRPIREGIDSLQSPSGTALLQPHA